MTFDVGVLAVGLFADDPVPLDSTSGRVGLLKGMVQIRIIIISSNIFGIF